MRSRLSLHDFNTILDMINDENHWLANAMKIALITGQRISDISKMKWEDIYDDKLLILKKDRK
ncbi:MAG: tyrosine-type recombinase/integrase [Arsenophonus endosymbiont of Dermacentor nuttalli]